MSSIQKMTQIDSVAQHDPGLSAEPRPKRFKHINVPFLATVVALVAVGLAVVYSGTVDMGLGLVARQAAGVIIGAVLMVLISRYNYQQLSHYALLFLVLSIVLILLPHIPGIGREAKGATSWVSIAGFGFQPGEIAKITVVLLAACVVARYGGRIDSGLDYLKSLIILSIPFFCIMAQPDLGTGAVYLFVAGVALIVGGARPRFIVITLVFVVGAVVVLFLLDPLIDSAMGSDVLLKDYQRARLLVFMDNDYDLSGEGYNLEQAKIAIGSGGLFGRGYMNALQSSHVPEVSTDFIFCLLAEQFGFMGVLLLLSLYALLIFLCFRIALGAADLFGTIIVMGIAGLWLFHILENIGMTCGLMPITGIPLPFLSYGPSFMVMSFVLLGLVWSVWAHSSR